MYHEYRKIQYRDKVELLTLLTPLFTYHEIIDTQERYELNHESPLEKASREYSLSLAKEYNKRIHRILMNNFICEERELLRVVYEKMYSQLILPVSERDPTYDYLILINICKKILS
jgi:hypothetical protein